jgi:hypothetical protein
MRSISIRIVAAFALTLGFVACGGDDGGDDVQTIDAAPSIDAPIDGPATSGLGQTCSATAACPTTGATECIILNQGDTMGFCTLVCGTSTAAGTPPTGGDAMCEAGYVGTATPACVFRDPAMPAPIEWQCGVLCGVVGTNDFGTCPGGQTCTGLTAQQPGVCYPG